MFTKLNKSILLSLLTLTVAVAGPAAADDPLGVLWVVDEWDGEIMPALSTPMDKTAGDRVVDERDGEVITARSVTVPVPYLMLIVEAPAPELQSVVLGDGAPLVDGPLVDGVVDEWDGEVMPARATVGGTGATVAVGSCQVMVSGEPLSYRVVKTYALHSPEVLPQP